eukprot:SAG11_NODE_332_length_10621_cov_13.178768_7_plen_50_part_00
MGKPTVGSSTKKAALPQDVEMEGILVKAGGQEGNKGASAIFILRLFHKG